MGVGRVSAHGRQRVGTGRQPPAAAAPGHGSSFIAAKQQGQVSVKFTVAGAFLREKRDFCGVNSTSQNTAAARRARLAGAGGPCPPTLQPAAGLLALR